MRVASQPLIGSTTAFETRYEVRTQVASSKLDERLPAMCGSDTLAMLVSSTSMNVARVTVSAMTQGLWPAVNPCSCVRRSDSAALIGATSASLIAP